MNQIDIQDRDLWVFDSCENRNQIFENLKQGRLPEIACKISYLSNSSYFNSRLNVFINTSHQSQRAPQLGIHLLQDCHQWARSLRLRYQL